MTCSRRGPQAVVADFPGGRLTTDAGALRRRQVARHLGRFDARDAALPDPRRPEGIAPDPKALLAPRIPALARGSEALNDPHARRADPTRPRVAGRDPDAAAPHAAPSTRGRRENHGDRPAWARMAAVRGAPFGAAPAEPPEAWIRDGDAPDDPIPGRPAGRCFPGSYEPYGFRPRDVFCGAASRVASLRPSPRDAAPPRRGIVKAEPPAQAPHPRFRVAPVPGDPQTRDAAGSGPRGAAANRIQEPQLDLFADRTSGPRVAATPFRLRLSRAADLRVPAWRRTAWAGTERAAAQVGTIRRTLRKVAARVAVAVRRVVFHRSRRYPSRGLCARVSAWWMGSVLPAADSG